VTHGPAAGGAATVGGLLLRSAQRWPDADAPELITVSELPRNASGKVIKKRLAELATETSPARASR
jgi:acyl-coenzyme A synthetase/AMP-(fatty) acid ligase